MKKAVVLAVHPDDETLGCGGTLLRHKAQGDEIYWIICTNITEGGIFPAEKVKNRKKEIVSVKESYGFDSVFHLNHPAMMVDKIPMFDIVTGIGDIFGKIKPDTVYLPFKGDIHSDHKIIFDAAFSCTKIFRFPYIKKILMMETISETEIAPSMNEFAFQPNYFVDITKYMNKKIEILNLYEGEIKDPPFPRSIENIKAQATFRGAMAGVKYAESFHLLKEII